MKFKKLASLFVAAAMSLSMVACSSSSSSEEETIKIGILFSETGSTAVVEKTMTNATIMAFDEINAAGGINGVMIEYVYEDYASDPATATEKIKKLIQQDEVVATVGCYTSASRQATLATLEEENSLLVYPTYTEGEEVHPNVIYVGCMPNQQATDYIPWILENVGTKVFLIGSDYVFPQTCNSQAAELIEMYGGEVVGEEYVDLDQTDFSTIIAKIEESGADVIYSSIVGDSNTSFYKDFQQYGLDVEEVPICSIAVDESNLQAIGEEYAEGHYASMPYFSSLDTEASIEFVEKYNELYDDGTVVTVLTESAYSSAYLLAAALEKVEDPTDTDALIDAFAGVEFDAPQGLIQVDEENHCTWVYSRFAQIVDGEFDIIYSSDEALRPEPWPSLLYPEYAETNFMPDWDDPLCYPQ